MLRGSDLTLLRNQIIATAKEVVSPKQKEYFSLVYEEGIPHEEVSKAYGLSRATIYSTLNNLVKPKIIQAKPFLRSREALKYKGAARILNMLAMQCDRTNEAHSEGEFSYSRLLENVKDVVDSEATDIQKQTYRKYFLQGKTQRQAGKEMGVCQPTVWKTLFGNHMPGSHIVYGGIITKVGKHLNRRKVPYCCHLIEPYGGLFGFIFGK